MASNKLYVSGIAWNTTEGSMTEFFQQFGQVIEAVIMQDQNTNRSRGFGFVTFASEDAVLAVLDGRELVLDGRKLELKRALSREELAAQGGRVGIHAPSTINRKLFVAGLSFDTTEESLSSYFSKWGEVETALVMRDYSSGKSRGFGFVTYVDASVLPEVMNEPSLEVDGRKIEVKHAVPKDEVAGRGGRDGGYAAQNNASSRQSAQTKIYVAGLNPETKDDAFRAYFEQFGAVVEAYVQKDRATSLSRRFGFVTFASAAIVDKVLATNHTLEQHSLDVKLAVPRGDGPSRASSPSRAPDRRFEHSRPPGVYPIHALASAPMQPYPYPYPQPYPPHPGHAHAPPPFSYYPPGGPPGAPPAHQYPYRASPPAGFSAPAPAPPPSLPPYLSFPSTPRDRDSTANYQNPHPQPNFQPQQPSFQGSSQGGFQAPQPSFQQARSNDGSAAYSQYSQPYPAYGPAPTSERGGQAFHPYR